MPRVCASNLAMIAFLVWSARVVFSRFQGHCSDARGLQTTYSSCKGSKMSATPPLFGSLTNCMEICVGMALGIQVILLSVLCASFQESMVRSDRPIDLVCFVLLLCSRVGQHRIDWFLSLVCTTFLYTRIDCWLRLFDGLQPKERNSF